MRSLKMKRYKTAFDFLLLISLAILLALAIAPESFVMPSGLQMLILTVALAMVAIFLVFLWREDPHDEREAINQAIASRSAYVVGAIVLIIALIIQSLKHEMDATEPIALMAMIGTKIFIQRRKDGR